MPVDMKMRWQDQEVVKKDGMWTVAGFVLYCRRLSELIFI